MGKFDSLKKLFIKILIGSLIAAAGLAVVAVLVGQLSDILWRSLMTLVLVALHSLASLFYIRTSEHNDTIEDLTVFSNAVFVIIVLSFVTSIFGTWHLFGGELVGKLYMTYFVLLFAVLHAELLSKTTGLERSIDMIVKVNYGFIALVVVLLQGVIYVDHALLSDMYFRGLAAAGIIDATLSILVMIFYKLYLQNHPKTQSTIFIPNGANPGTAGQNAPAKEVRRRTNPLVILLAVYLIGQLLVTLLFTGFGGIFGGY